MLKKLRCQRGQGLTEYAVVLSLVALAAIAAVSVLGSGLRAKIGMLSSAIVGNTESYENATKKQDDVANATKDEMSKDNAGMGGPTEASFGTGKLTLGGGSQ